MTTYRVEITIPKEKTISIRDLPFAVGERVEVVVRKRQQTPKPQQRYPLRGKPVKYAAPFESVAENDWDALR
jgi:hypothetical protein